MIHDQPSAFPYLTLSHVHADVCCGIDELTGKPSFICNYEFNACTTCLATGATSIEMEVCVRVRRDRARKNGHEERRFNIRGCF